MDKGDPVSITMLREHFSRSHRDGKILDAIACGSWLEEYSDSLSDIDVIAVYPDNRSIFSLADTTADMAAKMEFNIDITFYPYSKVEKEYLKGNPFFGYCIKHGVLLFDSNQLRELKKQSFPITEYTVEYEIRELAKTYCRIIEEINANPKKALRSTTKFAKISLLLKIIIEKKKLTRISNIKKELDQPWCQELLKLVKEREKHIHEPRKYHSQIIKILSLCLETEKLTGINKLARKNSDRKTCIKQVEQEIRKIFLRFPAR